LQTADEVNCAVNRDRRLVNSRLHSAAHVIDMIIDELDFPWTPTKGAHYPHMSFVEYKGELNTDTAARTRDVIEQRVNDAVRAGGQNSILFIEPSEMHIVCRHLPDNIPVNKPSRVVVYRNAFGVPCGGTHVRSLDLVGGVDITKIKRKDGAIRVSYSLNAE